MRIMRPNVAVVGSLGQRAPGKMAGKGGWPGQQTEVARKAPDSQRVVTPRWLGLA